MQVIKITNLSNRTFNIAGVLIGPKGYGVIIENNLTNKDRERIDSLAAVRVLKLYRTDIPDIVEEVSEVKPTSRKSRKK